jgi:uncharacterized protein (DUF362 family)
MDGGLYNLWGCYPDPMRLLHHKNLDYKLALLNKLVKNRVQIIDGFWSLDGHGPMEGAPVGTDKLLIANNSVAADAAAACLMNLEATKIGHKKVAEQFGLGTADVNRIHFNTPIQEERFSEFKPYKITLDYFQAFCSAARFYQKPRLHRRLRPSYIDFLTFSDRRKGRLSGPITINL